MIAIPSLSARNLLSDASPPPLAPGPPDDVGHVRAHGFLWYFVAVVIQLVVIAGSAAAVRFMIQSRSGAESPETAQRVWSRSSEIRRQPVKWPFVFAICNCLGAQELLLFIGILAFTLVGFPLNSVFTFIVALLSMCAAAWVSVVVYRMSGGTKWKLCAFGTLMVYWAIVNVMSVGAVMNVPPSQPPPGDDVGDAPTKPVIFTLMSFFSFLVLMFLQTPFFMWGGNKDVPPVAEPIETNAALPKSAGLSRTMLTLSVPLALLYALTEYMLNLADPTTYISRIVGTLAPITLLAGSAVASVVSVHSLLLNNAYQWQWRAYLTPALPLFVIDALKSLLFHANEDGISGSITIAACAGVGGVLGGYAYIALAGKYSQTFSADLTPSEQPRFEDDDEPAI